MNMKIIKTFVLLFAVASFAVTSQAQGPAEQPSTGVGHISLIHGDVSMQRGDSGDWAAAGLNTPLVRGDQIATGQKSRAEIQLDYANIVRLAAASQVKIADLTRLRIQIQVAQGYANYSMFKGGEADVEIDTPNVAVRPLKQGRYRIQVNSDSETDVIVRDGEAQITTPQGSTTVKSGQQITIRGTDSPEYRVDSAPGKDDWDNWNKDRDRIIRDAEGWRRTNSYYTGVQDLDSYGHWVYIPGYGQVWQPYQTINWAPYQLGHWVWEPYYGWTWVSYEPWGWAPYHYGRWFLYGSSWYWYPGPVFVSYRPIYAPAYVFFIGFGHHFSAGLGFGFGSIGWLPCGPRDVFYPWYGRGFNRIHVTNITNVTNVTNITNINNVNVHGGAFVPPLVTHGRIHGESNLGLALTNSRIRQAITSVPMEDFSRGGTLNRRSGMDVAALQQAHMVAGNVPVVPERESLRSSENVSGTGSVTPKTNEHFFVKSKPPEALPPFQEQAAKVQQVIQTHAPDLQVATRNSVWYPAKMGPPETSTSQPGPVTKMGPPESSGTNVRPQPPTVTKLGPPEQDNKGSQGLQKFGTPPITKMGPPENIGANIQSQPPTVTKTGPPEQDNRSQGFQKFGTPGPVAKIGPPESTGTTGQPQPPVVTKLGPPAQDNRGGQGFQKFGTPAITPPRQVPPESIGGGGQQQPPNTVAKLGPPEEQQDKSKDSTKQQSGSTKSSQGWQKFGPPAGGPGPVPPESGGLGHQPQPPSQQQTPQQQPPANAGQNEKQNQNQNGWQKFPSGSNGGTSQKPPLDLRNPIVTPRPTPEESKQMHPMPPTPNVRIDPSHGSMNGGDSRSTPPSHIEPRVSPPVPAPRIEPRISPPTPAPHNEPSHGSGGGSNSHSSGSSGGSNHSSSSDSKSSKGPH